METSRRCCSEEAVFTSLVREDHQEQDKVTTGPKGWDFLNQSIGDEDKVVTGENSGPSQGEIFIFCWKEMFYWFVHSLVFCLLLN